MKNLNKVFLFLLFLNLSETYRVILYYTNIPSVVISAITTIFSLIYILCNTKYLAMFLKRKLFNYWLILIFVIPTISIIINHYRGLIKIGDMWYWLSFNALFAFLYVCSVIISYVLPLKTIKNLMWVCIGTTLVGFVVNVISPEMIRRMGELTGSTLAFVVYGSDESRNMSFFAHPNTAAFSIVCYFIFLFTTFTDKLYSIKYYIFCAALLMAMVAITGSRTSLIISVIMLFLYIRPLIAKTINLRYKKNAGSVKLTLYSFLVVGAIFGIGILYVLSLTGKANSSGSSRYSIFSSLFDPSKDVKDESIEERTSILGVYFRYIYDSIYLGYGPAIRDNKIDRGQFDNVSQNTYVEETFIYGIFYAIYYAYINLKTYLIAKKWWYKRNMVYNTLAVFMLFLFIMNFSVNDLFWNRAIVITLGLIVGIYLRNRSNTIKELQPSLATANKETRNINPNLPEHLQ